jgi:hypothetical protein
MISKGIHTTALALLILFTSLFTPVFASNDSMLELLKVLRDNGTITDEAYSVLVNSAEADKERTDAKIEETAEEKVASVKESQAALKWAEKIKFKGDLRLRRQYENFDPENGSDQSRERYRYRLRLGAIADIHDDIEVGLGFASGSDDPRSTNETFDDNFSTKDARIDYAYAQWKAAEWATIIGGKFKRKEYLWAPTDLLWDGAIKPEGISVNLQNKNNLGTTFGNVGWWYVDELSSDSNDPALYYGQVGQKYKSGDFFANVAAAYYKFDDFANVTDDGSGGGNSINIDDNEDAWGLSVETGLNNSIFGKKARLLGEYVESGADDEESGYAVGFKLGDSKVKERGTWQIKYIYADLEENAFPNIFPDSDRFGGDTGMTAHEIEFQYAIAKNIIAVLDYYDAEQDKPGEDDDEQQILQTDIIFKF